MANPLYGSANGSMSGLHLVQNLVTPETLFIEDKVSFTEVSLVIVDRQMMTAIVISRPARCFQASLFDQSPFYFYPVR